MLTAILADFHRVPGCEVWTTWDRRLGPWDLPAYRVYEVSGPDDERRIWNDLIDDTTDVLLIAPESDGMLEERATFVERRGGRLFGPSSEAIHICGDKWETFQRLNAHHIPTIETRLFPDDSPIGFSASGYVLKPRDGAGSQRMRFIHDSADLNCAYQSLTQGQTQPPEYLLQPFIEGTPLSCAALVAASDRADIFPLAKQIISRDGAFSYLGGEIPAELQLLDCVNEKWQELIRQACRFIPGLRGYVGFDLLIPDDDPENILLVEINPRLTTSYLGYRQLTTCNLAERMLNTVQPLNSTVKWSPIPWHRDRIIRFTPAMTGSHSAKNERG
ncbi:MAG: ATP-grasp domain-containing protein [Planctomycetaceae bacterium]